MPKSTPFLLKGVLLECTIRPFKFRGVESQPVIKSTVPAGYIACAKKEQGCESFTFPSEYLHEGSSIVDVNTISKGFIADSILTRNPKRVGIYRLVMKEKHFSTRGFLPIWSNLSRLVM